MLLQGTEMEDLPRGKISVRSEKFGDGAWRARRGCRRKVEPRCQQKLSRASASCKTRQPPSAPDTHLGGT